MYSTQSQLHNFEVNSLKLCYFGRDSSLTLSLKFTHMQRISERLAAPRGPAKGLPAGCSVCVWGMAAQVCVCLCNPMWMGCLCWPQIGQHKSGDHGGGGEQPKGGELGYVLILWRIIGYHSVYRMDSSCKGAVLLVCVHTVGMDPPVFCTGRRRVSHTGKIQFRILCM